MNSLALHLLSFLLPVMAAPLLLGIVDRTKAIFAGRKGRPLLQHYFDLIKLTRKGAVYSKTTSWVFRALPLISLSSFLISLLFIPLAGTSVFSFQGDLLLVLYLFTLTRFFLVIGALDTGSAFEGMGSSREAFFSFLVEPSLFLSLAALTMINHDFSLSGILHTELRSWPVLCPALALVALCFFLLLLIENSRIPFDDPNTHLELTMIHEVMILDHGGPDLALLLYSASLKFWIFCAFLVPLVVPFHFSSPVANMALFMGSTFLIAIFVGTVESLFARVRLLDIPQLLVLSALLPMIALIVLFMR
jgi:formate hydrogenlyase subunit 4